MRPASAQIFTLQTRVNLEAGAIDEHFNHMRFCYFNLLNTPYGSCRIETPEAHSETDTESPNLQANAIGMSQRLEIIILSDVGIFIVHLWCVSQTIYWKTTPAILINLCFLHLARCRLLKLFSCTPSL